MKKLLLAMAICVSPVINIAASADKMYTDLVESIISNNKTTSQKLYSLNRVQEELTHTKEYLQTKLLNQYSYSNYPQDGVAKLIIAYIFGLAGTIVIIGEKLGDISKDISQTQTYLIAITCLSASAFFFCEKYAQTTICTKKIKEIDTVLAKLIILKKELQKELYFGSN